MEYNQRLRDFQAGNTKGLGWSDLVDRDFVESLTGEEASRQTCVSFVHLHIEVNKEQQFDFPIDPRGNTIWPGPEQFRTGGLQVILAGPHVQSF